MQILERIVINILSCMCREEVDCLMRSKVTQIKLFLNWGFHCKYSRMLCDYLTLRKIFYVSNEHKENFLYLSLLVQ